MEVRSANVVFAVIFSLLVSCVVTTDEFNSENKTEDKCGYQACPVIDPDKLNVHLVPHSHLDVGWLKTVDQYFYGTNSSLQNANVSQIIDSVLAHLESDPTRRFIWVETAYLWRWWKQAEPSQRELLRSLVRSGRLEITGGAWTMHDEAVTHYQAVIDNFAWGFRKLYEEFGECSRPRVGWQVDSFGHSSESASLMAQFGFDGLFLGRIHFEDKARRLNDQDMEFVWKSSQYLGKTSNLFTKILRNVYWAPRGFCFDILCKDAKSLVHETQSVVDSRIDAFIDLVKEQAAEYRTKNILITMGNDFNYMNATPWYTNMDKLIELVNERRAVYQNSTINVLYSTPACYLKAVHQRNLTWSTKEDDFFPYASDKNEYWTGFFTSRPTLKFMERRANHLLQVCKQLHVLGQRNDSQALDELREVVAMMQHHDAVTGTEKQHVADDYAERMHRTMQACHDESANIVNQLMKNNSDTPEATMTWCPLLSNESKCEVSEQNSNFVVTLYNPLARSVSQHVRLPVPWPSAFQVIGPEGDEVQFQLVPTPQSLETMPERANGSQFELIFRATNLPPLGFKSFFIKTSRATNETEPHHIEDAEQYRIGNDNIRVKLDPETKLIQSITVKNKEIPLSQNYLIYDPINRYNRGRPSGAYIFRPDGLDPIQVSTYTNITIRTYKGPVVEEIHQVFESWMSQVIRVYRDEEHVELEWLAGPLPLERHCPGDQLSTSTQSHSEFV